MRKVGLEDLALTRHSKGKWCKEETDWFVGIDYRTKTKTNDKKQTLLRLINDGK